MHDHLKDMGMDLASRHSPSRVWLPGERFNIEKQARERSIRGIFAGELEYTDEPLRHEQRFKKFIEPGLKLFTSREANSIKDFAAPSEDLVWLHVYNFKKRNLPLWFSLRNLRYMTLLDAVNLRDLWPNTDNPPLHLTELRITSGHMLQKIPTSIGHLKELRRIQLYGCKTMKNLPEEFCCLSSLEKLDLYYCKMLSSLPARFGDLTNLRRIYLRVCERLQRLPVSFKQLRNLQHLDLSFCEQLSVRLDMLENIQKLEYLNFSFCRKLVELPNRITDQVYLRELCVSHTGLRKVPTTIDQLHKLERLEIGSGFLKSLPSSLGNLSSLTALAISGHLLTGWSSSPENLSHHTELELAGRAMLNFVPDFLKSLNKLKKITISVTSVSRISLSEYCCPSLETLILDNNYALEYIGRLPTSLQAIEVDSCKMLKNIEGIDGLINLRALSIRDCAKLDEPSSFVDLHSIKDISIRNCDKFLKALTSWKSRGIQSWEEMEKLKTLEVVAENTSALQPCIQAIMKWPCQMSIGGRAASGVESVMESLSFPNLTVIREREGLLECGKTHTWDAAIVCIVVKVLEDHYIKHPFLPVGKDPFWVWELRRGQWVFVCVETGLYPYGRSQWDCR